MYRTHVGVDAVSCACHADYSDAGSSTHLCTPTGGSDGSSAHAAVHPFEAARMFAVRSDEIRRKPGAKN